MTASFEAVCEKMRQSTEALINGDPIKAVEVIKHNYNLTDGERNGVLKHLLSEGDLSQFGMVNALTRYSQDVDSYDRATDFERLGGTVLELPKSQWKIIAEAA